MLYKVYKKYFIAIVLTGELLEKAEHIKHELFERYGLKGALRSPAHITLHRPFQWKEEKEEDLINILSGFKFNRAFTLELNNFSCFAPRVVYIDIKANNDLFILHKELSAFAAARLKLLNEVEDMRGFHPHITVAFRDLKRALFHELWNEFKSRTFFGSFEVKSLSLLKLESKWEIHKTFSI